MPKKAEQWRIQGGGVRGDIAFDFKKAYGSSHIHICILIRRKGCEKGRQMLYLREKEILLQHSIKKGTWLLSQT